MSRYQIAILIASLVAAASASQFSCNKSAFIFADSDPQSQDEFSARNPAAGGIIVAHMNNQTTTYHYDNTTNAWVKDPEPTVQCQLDVITDPQMPSCLNISGMPYCETPPNIVQQIRKNMTEQPPTPDRMPIWVDKVCQSPSSAYVRIMFGKYGAHFLAAYQTSQQLQNSSEYSQNITQLVNNLLTKKQCEGGQDAYNATSPAYNVTYPASYNATSPGSYNATSPAYAPPASPGYTPPSANQSVPYGPAGPSPASQP